MSESTKGKGWTPVRVAKSAWASTRLQEPWAVTLEPGRWSGLEIRLHTLGQVLDMAVGARLLASPVYTIPAQVNDWMRTLNLTPVSALIQATRSLSQDQSLDVLAGWFNGGNGLPSPSSRPGSARENAKIRLNLGHPSLLNQFLCWLIRYLGAHDHTDARIYPDCERVINLCREIQGKSPVRRF